MRTDIKPSEQDTDTIRFTVDQLRQDKIIYAVEAGATSVVCLLGFFFSNQYFHGTLKDTVNTLLLVIAGGYTIYMAIGNTYRWLKILRLERKYLR